MNAFIALKLNFITSIELKKHLKMHRTSWLYFLLHSLLNLILCRLNKNSISECAFAQCWFISMWTTEEVIAHSVIAYHLFHRKQLIPKPAKTTYSKIIDCVKRLSADFVYLKWKTIVDWKVRKISNCQMHEHINSTLHFNFR